MSSARKATSPAFPSWVNLQGTFPHENVSDDLSSKSVSLRIVELENAICNQDKLLCKVFRENKKSNLELESAFLKLLLLG
jgi:hypothetical protein